MSSIRTTVETLEDVRPHTNSDNLNLANCRGWQMVMNDRNAENPRRTGDRVVYFEAGTVLPLKWAEEFDVVKYLSNKTDIDGNKVLVVGKVRLRGEPSYGLTVPLPADRGYWQSGEDVSHYYGTSKYRPPVKMNAGDAEEDDPRFEAYIDIENLQNFPSTFAENEQVDVTEKLHGTNCRVGYVVDMVTDPDHLAALGGGLDREITELAVITQMAGSREVRRKDPGEENWKTNTYWLPWSIPQVQNLMRHLYEQKKVNVAILYGEVFGGGIQKGFDYGVKTPAFRAFAIKLDGQFMDPLDFRSLIDNFNISWVPSLYTGPYSLGKIKELSEGKTTIVVGGQPHMREGVVVAPVKGRKDPKLGDVILKYVSDSFRFRKGGDEDDTTDV